MLKNYRKGRSTGFTLIEALIAVLVVALGILAIGKLNGFMMASSGHSKARAEAVALAEEKVEEMRRMAVNNFATIAGSSAEAGITGKNATFSRTWTVVAGPADESKQIQVTVAWTDPQGNAQNVALSTHVTSIDAVTVAALADDVIAGGRLIAPPTGDARVGGDNTYTPGAIPGQNQGDGTSIYAQEDGPTELIDNLTGKVLLTIDDGRAFSKISGQVYIAGTSVSPSNIFVMSSDASACIKTVADPLARLPATGSLVYTLFDYSCYVGPGWYGNIGIVRIDNANANDRVCVGDPGVSTSVEKTSISGHPALSTTRIYRGYNLNANDVYVSSGIGIGMIVDEEDQEVVGYAAEDLDGHNFLLTTITGQVTDESCRPQMVSVGEIHPFDDSPAKLHCLTLSCPTVLPTGDSPKTTVNGTIQRSPNNDRPTITQVIVEGGSCTLGSSGQDTTFQCVIDWQGWTAETWNTKLTVQSSESISLAGTGLPTGISVNCSTREVLFTTITPDTQSIAISLIATKDGTCP